MDFHFIQTKSNIYISLQRAYVTHYILPSWKKSGIELILKFEEVKEVKLFPENVINNIFNQQSPEYTNEASQIAQEEISNF